MTISNKMQTTWSLPYCLCIKVSKCTHSSKLFSFHKDFIFLCARLYLVYAYVTSERMVCICTNQVKFCWSLVCNWCILSFWCSFNLKLSLVVCTRIYVEMRWRRSTLYTWISNIKIFVRRSLLHLCFRHHFSCKCTYQHAYNILLCAV